MSEAEAAGLTELRVAVTRPAEGAGELAALLEASGAVPVVVPLIVLGPAADPAPLLEAAARLTDYDWVVFTSATAVRFLHHALVADTPGGAAPPRGLESAHPAGDADADRRLRRPRRIAAVGSATARAVAELLHWPVDAVPDEYVGDAVARAMGQVASLRGARVLWPRAEAAREGLPRELAAAGAMVDAPIAYRTTADPAAARRLAALVAAGGVDVLTFTSPSAVAAFAEHSDNVHGCAVAVIGPTTAAAARQNGLPVHVEPEHHTITALVRALGEFVEQGGLARSDRGEDEPTA